METGFHDVQEVQNLINAYIPKIMQVNQPEINESRFSFFFGLISRSISRFTIMSFMNLFRFDILCHLFSHRFQFYYLYHCMLQPKYVKYQTTLRHPRHGNCYQRFYASSESQFLWTFRVQVAIQLINHPLIPTLLDLI